MKMLTKMRYISVSEDIVMPKIYTHDVECSQVCWIGRGDDFYEMPIEVAYLTF